MSPPTISRFVVAAMGLLLSLSNRAPAQQPPAALEAVASVEKLVESARPSVVVITFTGRDGQREGMGAGFVVSKEGLIATNLHVIGEARPIWVETADGRRFRVTSVHASDRAHDLAVLRVDSGDLAPLELGDSDSLEQGQPVVAIGNPHGLVHSVVAGIVSGEREIDGKSWIQLAIPIEPGNSGGPLLDMQGRVHGLLTMKSLVTANLGFAVPINRLKPLLENPNPIAIDRWLTIGTLDPDDWTPLFGARWRRRAGRIVVDGSGSGFGGRSLCLSQVAVLEPAYEVAVSVRLGQEAGAAGLAFGSDGGERHFGFYPSAGRLRLTRFDGPDVTSWTVLAEEASPHYRAGDWNTLKVRVEPEKLLCYVNDHLVFEAAGVEVQPGRAGLAQFRSTAAEFKRFRLAANIASDSPGEEIAAKVRNLVADVPANGPLEATLVEQLAPHGEASRRVLADEAARLDQQAAQLRRLAAAVHQRQVLDELDRLLQGGKDFDLFHAALLIARLDNDEVDVESYRQELERMAAELSANLADDASPGIKLAALNEYLFQQQGFHGSRGDYYNRSNSYLNEVLDDREGLPITLSLLYIELGRRIGIELVGVGLPGHFVVEHRPAEGQPQLIDVFEAARPITREEAERRVLAATGRILNQADLEPVGKRDILIRMLHNLQAVAGGASDLPGVLRYLDAILLIRPDSPADRWYRAVFRFQSSLRQEALEDIDWLLAHPPAEIDRGRIEELRRLIDEQQDPHLPQNR